MSTQSATSKSDTATQLQPISPARSRFDRDGDWMPDAAGTSSMPGSTPPGRHRATPTEDECEIEFIMDASNRHPVGIVCTTHDWKGDIV